MLVDRPGGRLPGRRARGPRPRDRPGGRVGPRARSTRPSWRRGARPGRPMPASAKVGVFLASLAAVVLVCLSAIIAFVATCLPIGLVSIGLDSQAGIMVAFIAGADRGHRGPHLHLSADPPTAGAGDLTMKLRDHTLLGMTQSLCPECLALVPAKIIARGGGSTSASGARRTGSARTSSAPTSATTTGWSSACRARSPPTSASSPIGAARSTAASAPSTSSTPASGWSRSPRRATSAARCATPPAGRAART